VNHTGLFTYIVFGLVFGLTLMFSVAIAVGTIAALLQWIKDSGAPPTATGPAPTPSMIIAVRAGTSAFVTTLTTEAAIATVVLAVLAVVAAFLYR